jgi:replicative DNA helicase
MVRSFNLEAAADIVRDRADRRRLIHAASKIADDAYGSTEDAKVILERAEKQIFDLAHQQVRGDFVSAEQLVTDGMPAIEQLMDTKKGVTGVATGFLDLDLLTRGLQPGALVLLAARPSMGKTSFALNVAHYAATHGTTVGLFSLEMSKEELLMRLVSSVGRIDGHRLQSGYVNQSDYDRISDAFTTVAHSRLFVDDSPGVGVLDMRGKARRLKARAGLDLVIVDYLQLMQLDRAENRNVAVAEASRALKLMARELEVPVVALSQLSRATEQRGGDKKPMLSDLRDSGALEQDADVVLFIHRPEFYHQTPENEGLAEVMIAKQRNGPTGVVKLRWSKAETRFDNWDPARQDDPQLWDGEPV